MIKHLSFSLNEISPQHNEDKITAKQASMKLPSYARQITSISKFQAN